jgi:hypothetical protein
MIAAPQWDPAGHARSGAFVPELGLPVVDLLAPVPGERIHTSVRSLCTS